MPFASIYFQRGLRSAQPAATAVNTGTLYHVTDESVTERSSGSAWESFSDGGGSGAVGDLLDVVFIRKTADESVTSSTTMQDDNELTFAVGASEVWAIELVIGYSAAASVGDIRIAFGVPSGATGRRFLTALVDSATGVSGDAVLYSTTSFSEEGTAAGGDAFDATLTIKVMLVNSTNAGSFTLRWAQGASNGTATIVRANSWLKAERYA